MLWQHCHTTHFAILNNMVVAPTVCIEIYEQDRAAAPSEAWLTLTLSPRIFHMFSLALRHVACPWFNWFSSLQADFIFTIIRWLFKQMKNKICFIAFFSHDNDKREHFKRVTQSKSKEAFSEVDFSPFFEHMSPPPPPTTWNMIDGAPEINFFTLCLHRRSFKCPRGHNRILYVL